MVTSTIIAAVVLGGGVQGRAGLKVGKDTYLPGPSIRLGSYIRSEKFSRDGKYLTYIDERPEGSYAVEKDRIRKGIEPTDRALVRFELARGLKQTLLVPKEGETVMSIEPVGVGGDIVCTIALGAESESRTRWRAMYFPVGGAPRVVADDIVTRSFQVAASFTERKAFILLCGQNSSAQYIYITPEQTVVRNLPAAAYQGAFFARTAEGNPVAALQGPAPGYELVGNFEMSFATGVAIQRTSLEDVKPAPQAKPLIEFSLLDRSKGDPKLGQSPLKDIFATAPGQITESNRILVAQGVTMTLSEAPNGLALTFLTSEGSFLKEMVRLEPKTQG